MPRPAQSPARPSADAINAEIRALTGDLGALRTAKTEGEILVSTRAGSLGLAAAVRPLGIGVGKCAHSGSIADGEASAWLPFEMSSRAEYLHSPVGGTQARPMLGGDGPVGRKGAAGRVGAVLDALQQLGGEPLLQRFCHVRPLRRSWKRHGRGDWLRCYVADSLG